MLLKILKNFNTFVDGRGYAGRIDEISLPKLSIKTEDHRAGGMDIPVAIDMGMEKLEAELTFSEYAPELFRLFGLVDGNAVSLTLRGGLQGSGDAEAVVVNLRGQFKELGPGNWKPADKAMLKCTVSISYYKLTIDAENMVRKINGVDQMSSLQTALGI